MDRYWSGGERSWNVSFDGHKQAGRNKAAEEEETRAESYFMGVQQNKENKINRKRTNISTRSATSGGRAGTGEGRWKRGRGREERERPAPVEKGEQNACVRACVSTTTGVKERLSSLK
jgi:hypothetical protein